MTETTGGAPHAAPRAHGGSADRLGPFLCWAVVFADIGTSVYYVPGILYSQVGRLAGVFVTMTLVVFLLLTIKYAEATVRFPEGGGEVAVASRGLNPWFGALGGMFILIDLLLWRAGPWL
jgi:amino acid transporter